MELVTGKNKKQFGKWIKETNRVKYLGDAILPFEMKKGVFDAYYDSLDIIIEISVYNANEHNQSWTWFIWWEMKKDEHHPLVAECESRNEAYREAFKKANEIVNSK